MQLSNIAFLSDLMRNFTFKANDEAGQDTLQVIKDMDNLNLWLYNTILPFCDGKILEIGSVIGNISSHFLNSGSPIMLSDIRESYCDHLKSEFHKYPNLLGVQKIDLIDSNFSQRFSTLLDSFDTVFALNVVEHIKEDKIAVANAYKLLHKGGHLIILVPAYEWLYNEFDKNLQHYRRYTQKNLKKLLESENLTVIHKQYFNFIGIFGWLIFGGMMKQAIIPSTPSQLYNAIVPISKWIDKLLFNTVGLSVICVGKK